jgi:cellulose synthase/poly-beta-1,6-N-acetylglucosamine synthase-like glycosyltransferase
MPGDRERPFWSGLGAGTGRSSPFVSVTAGVLAAVGLTVAASITDLLNQFLSDIRALAIPLGAIPVALTVVLAIVYVVRSGQEKARKAPEIPPLEPFHERDLTVEEQHTVTQSSASSGGTIRIWRKDHISTVTDVYVPKSPSLVPPPPTPFVRNLLVAFSLLVIAIMLYRHPFFVVYDYLAHGIGVLIFWPRPYSTILPVITGGGRVLPDYIFVVYFAFILAYLLASGVVTTTRFDRDQARRAIGIAVAYPVVSLLADAMFFTVGEPFSHSAVLLARGVIGGLFVAGLILTTVRLPEMVSVRPIVGAEAGVVLLFFLSLATATLLGLGILYLIFRYVGLGHVLVPIGVLLLLPIVVLTIWAIIGRAVYSYHLSHRPPPPLSVYHPPVSVIIPAFNEEGGIAETIRSVDLAARLYPGTTEILVGNDGSTDRTLSIAIREILDLKHARGAVLDLPHGGKANALNAMLRAAKGEIIVRIDADTRLSTTLGFAKIVPHFAEADIGGVQGLILPLQEEGWTRRLRFLEIAWNHMFLRRATMGFRACQVVDGAFSSFRRADLLTAGGWVEWNGEDTEITIRLQRQGLRMRYEPEAAAFEDVPANYDKLERQRMRWNRGGIFARYRHLYPSFTEDWAFGGLAMFYWLALFVRSGLRSGLYVYVVLAALFVPTIVHLAFILVLLLIPRGIILAYYFLKYRRGRWMGWILAYPVFSVIKQQFAIKAWGTMFPGEAGEYV